MKGWHARGYLPHFDSPEAVQHVVFRTRGSLPRHVHASDVGAALDLSPDGRIFAAPEAAAVMQSALLHFDAQRYRLLGWCVMPNHVHAVIEQIDGYPLGSIVRSWKIFVARRLAGGGSLWAKDYYDRFVRNEADLARVLDYVERNPVSAGFVAEPEDWPFSSAYRRA